MLINSAMLEAALEALPDEVRLFASRNAYSMRLKHGACIVNAGVPLPGPMFVSSGAMTVSRNLPDRGKAVVCFVRQGIWLMGDLVVSGTSPAYDGCAVGNADVIVWPRASFLEAYQSSGRLRDVVRDNAIGTQNLMLRELEQSLVLTLPQRLARRLLELADLVGIPADNNAVKLSAPVSHALLAASLGVTRQRIHGQLREWAALGWVESHYRDVVLRSPDALRGAAALA